MDKHFIEKVPEFFAPYTNDCFSNTLSSYCQFKGFNPDIFLAGHLSFVYDGAQGFVGTNYLLKPRATILFEEDEMNTSYPFLWFFKPAPFTAGKNFDNGSWHEGVINIRLLITEDENLAYRRTKELLQQDIPVICAVDLHYMPYHPAHEKLHGLHFIVITGYDEQEGIFQLFDRYKIAESDFSGRLPIEQVMQARKSHVPLNDHVLGNFTRPLLCEWLEPHIPSSVRIDEDALRAMLQETLDRMNGRKEVLGNRCGIPAMEAFRDNILSRKKTETDGDFVYYFKDYCVNSIKVVSRSRKRFRQFLNTQKFLFNPDLIAEFNELLDISSRSWDISANLCYKLGLSRKPEVIDNIVQQLEKVIAAEKRVVEQAGNYLTQH